MSITAYWKATTGFNVNAYPVTLGKSLKLCTATELVAHPMCGSNSPISNISYTIKYSDLSSSTLGRSAMNLTGGAQFKNPIPNNMANTWACEPAPTGDNAKVYRRIIFVACPTNVSFPNYCISDDCNANILIVENITSPNKLVAAYGNPSYPDEMQTYFNFSIALRHVCENPHSVWSSAPNQVQYTDVSDPDNPVTKSYYIYPVFIYVVGDHVFLIRDDYIGVFGGFYQNATNAFNMLGGGSSYYNFDTDDDYCLFLGMNVNGTGGETDLVGIFGDVFADPVPNPPVFIDSPISYQPSTLLNLNLKFKYSLSHSTISGSGRASRLNVTSDGDTSRELRRQQMARAGVYFVENGRIFKPIISGGIVTTYGTAEVPSEIDTYTDLNHPVPSGGGGGGGDEPGDDYVDMALGVSNLTLGGLTKYAILSKQELIDLVIDYNTNLATAGTNFSNHVICLYRLGFGASDLAVTSSEKIKMIQSAGNVDFESSANYSIVSRQTPFIHFGSIKVPRHTGTFYDFSPYSNYELYIPGCGWIPLPDNVAGRTLNVYLVFDLPTCSAKGIVRIAGGTYGGTTIATVNGIIGASVPFTIGENGMQRAAILSGSVQTAAALGTAFLGVGIGNPYMGASGVAMATTGIANNYVAGNTNFISTKGGASDFSAFGDGAGAILKYNCPEIDPVVNNTTFGSGFTVCDNPHVTFSASSAERDEIERLLANGVIL